MTVQRRGISHTQEAGEILMSGQESSELLYSTLFQGSVKLDLGYGGVPGKRELPSFCSMAALSGGLT